MKTSLPVLIGVLLMLSLLAAAGCGSRNNDNPNRSNFRLNLNGFNNQVGRKVSVKVTDVTNGSSTVVGQTTASAIATGAFNVDIPNVIQANHQYQIDTWVDVDNNGVVDRGPTGNPAGVDLTWRTTAMGTSTGLTSNLDYTMAYTDITPW
jgi:hypothetical protein